MSIVDPLHKINRVKMEYGSKEILNVVKSESDSDEEELIEAGWSVIPENVLVKIFKQLSVRDILNCSETCKRWNFISRDSLLWKHKFQNDFNIDRSIPRKPGSASWYCEYKRLCDNVPVVLSEVITRHTHQVLHVSFSHSGKYFATTSKDGFIIVWNSHFPSSVKYEYDMKTLSWKYTQYSQFNKSDTLLLVSGVHFGSSNSTSGEIAVFSLTNSFQLRCRVQNKPYDIFGCWFSDQHLLSGELRWLAHLVSKSTIWLNKANQEVASENAPVMKELYNFYNRNASSIRNLMIAQCPWMQFEDDNLPLEPNNTNGEGSSRGLHQASGNPISNVIGNTQSSRDQQPGTSVPYHPLENENFDYERPFNYEAEFRKEFDEPPSEVSSDLDDFDDDDDDDDEEMETSADDEFEDLCESCPKYLIFSTGSRTFTPHQIGFKKIDKMNFPKRLDPGPSIRERIALRERRRQVEALINSLSPEEARLQIQQFNGDLRQDPDWGNFDEVADRFDGMDALIDLEGHIIGMALSPDHRFLYVNSRPWPQGCVITNVLDPPPISQEIDIHVIDLQTLKKIGTMLRAHKAYTPNTECFFIFLDVCENYVGSGAEDSSAYTWDRYYGNCLASYPHTDVVNSVAFNPKDDQMFISTSDDYEIKIWRSQASMRELGFAGISRANEVKNKPRKKNP